MTDPLAAARTLIDLGVPVFACPPGDGPKGFKLPLAWQAIKPDPKRLEVWRDGYALAAVCGHAFDVIDMDPRNSPGPLPFALPNVYGRVATGGGGIHLYVAATGTHKGVIAPGWDLQAGTADGGRGFVFLPGTPGYEWIAPPTRPEAGDESGAALRAHMATKRAERPATSSEPVADLGVPIPLGAHQDTLFRYACSLRARAVPEHEAAVLIAARARDCTPPWGGPDDPWTAVGHAYRYPEGEIPTAPEEITFQGPPLPAGPAPTVAVGPTPVDWREAWKEQEPIEWIVPSLVPRGAGVVLYSPPGVGKSLLSLELSLLAVRAGLTVAYVDLENDLRNEVVRRLREMGAGPEDLDGLRFYSFPELPPLDRADGGRALATIAEGADMVVLDTISRLVAGEENSNDTWNAYYRATGLALKAAGVACLRLDHAGKDAERGQRGGSAKAGDVDIIWRLSEVAEDEYSLTCEKNRMPLPEKYIRIRRAENPLRHVRIEASELNQKLTKQREVWAALEDASAPADITRREAARILKDSGVQVAALTLADVLKAWKEQANFLAARPAWAPSAAAVGDDCLTFEGAPPHAG